MNLETFFQYHNHVALAFSGGVDSSYLLYQAVKCGADVRAYYVKSAFQPQFELNDATQMAVVLGVEMQIIELDVLSISAVTSNPADRCYHCKKAIFSQIAEHALADGYTTLLDGTNASDSVEDRPGMRALKELSVLSPLRECGLTKDQIRILSKDAGLFTWNKPAYACLATRIPIGTAITRERLSATEYAEQYLSTLGFSDFRVRMYNTAARIQIRTSELPLLLKNRDFIVHELKNYYDAVLLDLEVRDESIH